MLITTREQRRALKNVYSRAPLYHSMSAGPHTTPVQPHHTPITYREFRMYVMPTFGCDGAITVPWCGMWLCIERDGYTHS